MLTTTTEYALRALVHLVRLPAGESMLGRDLAEKASIPANYLAKILLTLRNAGYLEATRGHGGGYRLAQPPEGIALIDILEVFEGVRSRPGCLLGEKHECSDLNPCSAHAKWREVKAMYLHYLSTTTIAEIAAPPTVPLTAKTTASASTE
jgi:Rrf2 family protein